jgi:dihydroorotate dehydrogenase (fumarate)
LGLKLAPFVYRKQQQDILDLIAEFTEEGRNPIAFLTCTNTLGNCTMFLDQTMMALNGKASDDVSAKALPTQFGGLAGEPLHYLSLGHVPLYVAIHRTVPLNPLCRNVLAFSELLAQHSDPTIRAIKIIGVGGVTSAAAYRRMRNVGADAVACATALGLEGVGVFEKLLSEK